MREYGTQIVSGTSPGKGGTIVHDVPVYDTVLEAQKNHAANASIVFVPAPFAADAVFETLDAGLKTVFVITEHVPVKDVVELMSYAKQLDAKIIGPNTPGVITPGQCKVGIMPANVFAEGNVGVASRSGTLTYEIAAALTKEAIGQSTCLGVGGDPVSGLSFIDALELFRDDPQTKAVVLIGEIGGDIEELAAQYISEKKYSKPVVAYVAGRSAPVGKRMGHAGAIVMGKAGTAESKTMALEKAGVTVSQSPSGVAKLLVQALSKE
jgi:succinyl-CoA synthetase alpha subunit